MVPPGVAAREARPLPAEAFTYAVPAPWRDRHRVRRYGFHGTSHRYVSRRTAELLGPEPCLPLEPAIRLAS